MSKYEHIIIPQGIKEAIGYSSIVSGGGEIFYT